METIIKRYLLQELESHLAAKEITLIVGPRQAGKTTLMLLLKDILEKRGENTAFLSLDSETDRAFFVSQEILIKKLDLELGGRRGYVFIDEIQRKEDAGIFLKGIYDMNLPYKFIVSGSGSMELKEKIHESLAGRKRIFELNPISFREFVDFKTSYRYEKNFSDFLNIEEDRTAILLREYMNFGGYPRVVLERELKEKTKIIDEIFRSYLEKDISYLLRVERVDAFSSLIKILASQIGELINYSELASTIGVSLPTIKNYFWYAEKTFIVQKLTPYFKNTRKEIIKSPTIYFYDLGFRNYALGLFGSLEDSAEIGFLFENLLFNILKDKFRFGGGGIHFWRTKDKAEVDFVVNFGKDILPIEVKYKKLREEAVGRSMRSFIEKYHPKEAWIVNLGFEKDIQFKDTTIRFFPFTRLF